MFALAVIGAGGYVARKTWYPGKAFDAVSWRKIESMDAPTDREQMADRFVARGLLFGKTKDDIVAMLGDPPETGYFHDWDLVYWLGQERGFIGIDSEWLVVRFGQDGFVTEYHIVHD